MGEFRSRLEDFFEVKELDFEQPEAFGRYKVFFPEEAVKHPAKAYTDVLEWIVKRYTKPGDIILDPMAGTGSTGVVATLHGRHAILVDIEERFVEWMNKAKELVEKHQTLIPKGKITVVHGDARKLSQLLREHVNVIVTSPPYAETRLSGGDIDKRIERMIRAGEDPRKVMGGRARNFSLSHYSDDPNNIGNLSYGDVDVIITSPPYSGTINKHAGGPTGQLKVRVGESTLTARAYSESEDNIGNLPHGDIDAIITSPPYEESMGSKHSSPRAGELMEDKRHVTIYGASRDNIENLKGETYLEAMLKVYVECYKVLKPGGKIAIIIKPFIRNKQVVDLPWHTHLLMTKVGFRPHEFFKYKLKHMSFWRLLYYKKHPEVPKITNEYILVYEKPIGD